MLALIFMSCVALFLTGYRRWSVFATLVLACGLIVAAGFRLSGFDYEEYVIIIQAVRAGLALDLDFFERLAIAKDPMMLFIVEFLDFIGDEETWPIFLAFAFISVSTKAVAAIHLGRFSILFFSLYLLLLSPGFEFAAMRAAAAMGFLVLIVSVPFSPRFTPVLWCLAIMSHVSAAFIALGIPISGRVYSRRGLFLIVSVAAIISLIFSGLLTSLDRAQTVQNAGTLNAVLFPAVTVAIYFVQLFLIDLRRNNIYGLLAPALGVSLGLALPAVTISFRLIELCWGVLLFALVSDLAKSNYIISRRYAFANGAVFISLLCVTNIFRETWSALFTLVSY